MGFRNKDETMKLWWDLETYSENPITDGAHKYAEKAEILLFAWAVDDGPVSCWDVTETPEWPKPLLNAINEADEYWGHNSGMFDCVVMKHAVPWFSTLMPAYKHRDTIVQALCHGLPGSLETLCGVFKLDSEKTKDKRGRQLIQMFCKPQPVTQILRRKTRKTHPKEWEHFIEYAKSDITSMRVLHKKMPKWNYPNHEFELQLWQYDQAINNRGICVDIELAQKAVETVNVAQAKLARDVNEATNGEVESATQRDALCAHILSEYGVSLPDMRAGTLERLLVDASLPDGVRELIAIRLMASTSSVSKYKRVVGSTSSDGYLRGVIQFSGAGRTGRDAGRLFQPQNLMRPTLCEEAIANGIEAIKAGCADLVTDNVMELCANVMRGVIIAPPGKKLVIADLSNIEGRVLTWLAGEEWKLQAFRDYDAGQGPDLYVASYAKTFNVSLEDANRQVGKVLELAMGFGGGVGSFITFAAVYRLDLEKLTAGLSLPSDVVAEAENFWDWSEETKRSTYGLPREVFIACDSLKRLWRRAHPNVCSFWGEAEKAFSDAINHPGKRFSLGKCEAIRNGNWLRIILPSKRSLSYAAPEAQDKLSFMGINQFSRKWQRIDTYGGKLVENITQAVARDVFKSCYPAVISKGYEIVMPVHDELLTYAPDREAYNPSDLSSLMATAPAWAPGLPLAAAGFESYRYKKK